MGVVGAGRNSKRIAPWMACALWTPTTRVWDQKDLDFWLKKTFFEVPTQLFWRSHISWVFGNRATKGKSFGRRSVPDELQERK